ncbi:MAG: precorrin-2 C(20)-methyltransferase [Xenococcaceae cyanobacterium MO_188.B32]|nr:precorrin-2 C(20)-methyltransferase [Xenococcaceae cyanobacterium MO_188.B32]
MQLGILYGISVGTGDPELITLKGLRYLQQCPIVAFPAGLGERPGIAQQIITDWLKPQQTTLALNFPYVQNESTLVSAWQQAARQVWQHLRQGKNVAFACEGDVSFYSTFTYLAQTLQDLHPEAVVKTVPGVCSPMAVASALQIPLTIRSQRLAILPAIYTIDELETVLDWAEVVILLKVNSVYERVWQVLHQRNLLDRSWIVEKATFPEQKIYRNLAKYPQLQLSYFSLLLIQAHHT